MGSDEPDAFVGLVEAIHDVYVIVLCAGASLSLADLFACVVGSDEGDASLLQCEACGAGEGSVGVGFVFFAFDGSAGGVDDDDFGFCEFAEFG